MEVGKFTIGHIFIRFIGTHSEIPQGNCSPIDTTVVGREENEPEAVGDRDWSQSFADK